jgi:hypothetical protein
MNNFFNVDWLGDNLLDDVIDVDWSIDLFDDLLDSGERSVDVLNVFNDFLFNNWDFNFSDDFLVDSVFNNNFFFSDNFFFSSMFDDVIDVDRDFFATSFDSLVDLDWKDSVCIVLVDILIRNADNAVLVDDVWNFMGNFSLNDLFNRLFNDFFNDDLFLDDLFNRNLNNSLIRLLNVPINRLPKSMSTLSTLILMLLKNTEQNLVSLTTTSPKKLSATAKNLML